MRNFQDRLLDRYTLSLGNFTSVEHKLSFWKFRALLRLLATQIIVAIFDIRLLITWKHSLRLRMTTS